MNRRERRNAKADAVKNMDFYLFEMHQNIQTMMLYVLATKFKFSTKRIDTMMEETLKQMKRISNGEISYQEMHDYINKMYEKKEEKNEDKSK